MPTNPGPVNPSLYQPPGLPMIAPAQPYSPAAAREPLLTSSLQTPVPIAIASPQQRTAPKPGFTPSGYEWMNPGNQSSPNHPHPAAQTVGPVIHHPITTTTRSNSVSQPAQLQVQEREEPASNGYERLINPPSTHSAAQPVRPSPPYLQFCEHMRPQLEADNYPREHLQSRIDEEWRKLSQENRGLWEERYNDQMRDYEDQMDIWKRTQRNANATAMRSIR